MQATYASAVTGHSTGPVHAAHYQVHVGGGKTKNGTGKQKNGDAKDDESQESEKIVDRKKVDSSVVADVLKTCRAEEIVQKSHKSKRPKHKNAKSKIQSFLSHRQSKKGSKKQQNTEGSPENFGMVSIQSSP